MHLLTKKASNTDAKSKCSQAVHAEMHLQTKKASNEDAKSKCSQAAHGEMHLQSRKASNTDAKSKLWGRQAKTGCIFGVISALTFLARDS